MGRTVNQRDAFDANERAGGLQSVEAGGTVSLEAECAMLREDLALSQRELAQVRLRQEDREERLAELSMAEAERDRLANVLARHLSSRPQGLFKTGGMRGWLARRLFGSAMLPANKRDPQVALIEGSGLFDAGWYLRTYFDVAIAGEDPVVHYLYHGAAEGRAAGPRFDTAFYLARYPEVKDSGLNPLVHYIQSGRSAGLLPVRPMHEHVAVSGAGVRRLP